MDCPEDQQDEIRSLTKILDAAHQWDSPEEDIDVNKVRVRIQ
jgi:hypothetical protein